MLIGLAVRLIIPDTTALSARQALHRAGLLGLQDVRREVCWAFDLNETEAPHVAAERLLTVDVLVNYNKHRGRWWRGELETAPTGDAMAARWGRIIVEDREDPEPDRMQRVLTSRLRLTGLRVVRHATLWSLAFAAGDDADRRTQEAVRLLLANRHGQRATLLPNETSRIGA